MGPEGVGDIGKGKCIVTWEKELENYRSTCRELEGRSRKVEEVFVSVALEIEKKKSELAWLEASFKEIEAEKLTIGGKIGVLKRWANELEEQVSRIKGNKVGEGMTVIDLSDEGEGRERVLQPMFENRVMECEKKLAKGKAEIWKGESADVEERLSLSEKKCMRLGVEEHPFAGNLEVDPQCSLYHVQSNGMIVDFAQTVCDSSSIGSVACSAGNRIEGLQMTGTPCADAPHTRSASHFHNGEKSDIHMESGKRVRKQLHFGEEWTPNKKVAPSTPAGARPSSVIAIDISDNDDEPDDILHVQKLTLDDFENGLKSSRLDQNTVDETSDGNENCLSTLKRRRLSNVVITDGDSNSDSDDILPICAVRRKYLGGKSHDAAASVSGVGDITDFETPIRRRLVKMRQLEEKDGPVRKSRRNLERNETKRYQGIPTAKSVEDEEIEETGSESEGESLGGFIVDSSDDSSDGHDCSDHTKDVSDDNLDYDQLISTIGRRRNHKSEWEFEADMLAAFGKDPELCMKAVCSLYRRQTSEEKCSKEALYYNQRGFSKFDAHRGSALAEFLTDGDPNGEVTKSADELLDYDVNALEHCKTLATRYSKQLFEIYKGNEDPFFHP